MKTEILCKDFIDVILILPQEKNLPYRCAAYWEDPSPAVRMTILKIILRIIK
jgi:hypothetical protein